MFLGLTGRPIRNSALANRLLALAEPVPLTLANLMTKSLTDSSRFMPLPCSRCKEISAYPRRRSGSARRTGPQCRHTSSSFTITRAVGSSAETYRSWLRLVAGADRRVRSSSSGPLAVKVMQSGRADIAGIALDATDLLEHGLTSQFRQRRPPCSRWRRRTPAPPPACDPSATCPAAHGAPGSAGRVPPRYRSSIRGRPFSGWPGWSAAAASDITACRGTAGRC